METEATSGKYYIVLDSTENYYLKGFNSTDNNPIWEEILPYYAVTIHNSKVPCILEFHSQAYRFDKRDKADDFVSKMKSKAEQATTAYGIKTSELNTPVVKTVETKIL